MEADFFCLHAFKNMGSVPHVMCENHQVNQVFSRPGKQFVVDKNGNAREQNRFDVEHFNSAKGLHDNDEVRFAMTEEQSANLANNEKNLVATASSIRTIEFASYLGESLAHMIDDGFRTRDGHFMRLSGQTRELASKLLLQI